MTSRRAAAVVLADAAVERADGDVVRALLLVEDPDLVPSELRDPVEAVLRDRLGHPDPFDGFS